MESDEDLQHDLEEERSISMTISDLAETPTASVNSSFFAPLFSPGKSIAAVSPPSAGAAVGHSNGLDFGNSTPRTLFRHSPANVNGQPLSTPQQARHLSGGSSVKDTFKTFAPSTSTMSSSVSSNAAFTTPYPKSAVKEAFAMSMQSPYGHRANSAKPPPKFSAAAVASPGAATSLSAASLSETERKMKALVSTCEQLKEERASLRAEMSKVTQETMDFQARLSSAQDRLTERLKQDEDITRLLEEKLGQEHRARAVVPTKSSPSSPVSMPLVWIAMAMLLTEAIYILFLLKTIRFYRTELGMEEDNDNLLARWFGPLAASPPTL